jgi:hypothetical protein
MLIDEIESIWTAIDQRDDWSSFDAKVRRVRVMAEAHGRTLVMPDRVMCPVEDL